VRGRIFLPQRIELHCSACGERFWVTLRSIDGRQILRCPFCGVKLETYHAVNSETRKSLYLAAREQMEELVTLELDKDVEFKC